MDCLLAITKIFFFIFTLALWVVGVAAFGLSVYVLVKYDYLYDTADTYTMSYVSITILIGCKYLLTTTTTHKHPTPTTPTDSAPHFILTTDFIPLKRLKYISSDLKGPHIMVILHDRRIECAKMLSANQNSFFSSSN